MDITSFIVSHRDHAFLLGDHGAYRSRLSKQLKTLRRSLGRATAKNAKYSYKPITAEDIGGNPEFAHIILLTAERAWAHAMYMKSSHAEDATAQKLLGSRRTHIVSRLTKAVKHAHSLADLLQQPASKVSKIDWLEAKAYAAYLQGSAELEKHSGSPKLSDKKAQREKWHDCLENLAVARITYGALLRSTKKDHFKEMLSGSIDSSMRFASYQSQIPRTVPVTEVTRRCFPEEETDIIREVEAIDDLAFKSDSSTEDGGPSGLPSSITWRGRKANLVDASIGQALVAVNTANEHLASLISSKSEKLTPKSQAAAYDEVLIASQDAVDATRHAIDDHEKEKIPEGDPRMQDLRVTSLAVNYDMIGWRVGRNRVLIGGRDGIELDSNAKDEKNEQGQKPEGRGRRLARLRERVVLYDAILQSIDSIKELRGAVRDQDFVEELEAKKSYFQALKCLNISSSHALLGNHENALALLVRAKSLCSSALESISSMTQAPSDAPLKLDISLESAKALQNHLELNIYQHSALVDLKKSNEVTKDAKGKDRKIQVPIIHRLNEYNAGGVDLSNLVTYPPKLQPVPVKPLFFDLAWNYVNYPGQSTAATASTSAFTTSTKAADTKDSTADDKGKPAKKGWFGFGR